MLDAEIVLTASAVYNILSGSDEKPTLAFRDVVTLKRLVREEPFWSQAFEHRWKLVSWFNAADVDPNTGRRIIDIVRRERAIYDWTLGDELKGCANTRFDDSDDLYIMYCNDSEDVVAIFRDEMQYGVCVRTETEYSTHVEMIERFGSWRYVPEDEFCSHLLPRRELRNDPNFSMDKWWRTVLSDLEQEIFAQLENSIFSIA